jgi:hypothetical protein
LIFSSRSRVVQVAIKADYFATYINIYRWQCVIRKKSSMR